MGGEALARRARLGVTALAVRTVVVQLSIFAGMSRSHGSSSPATMAHLASFASRSRSS